MATFQAVNAALEVVDPGLGRGPGEMTPSSASRLSNAVYPSTGDAFRDVPPEEQSARTPTRDSFGGFSTQPVQPATPSTLAQDNDNNSSNGAIDGERSDLSRGNSLRSVDSPATGDVRMGEDDDAQEGSDNESGSDSHRPSKKKKGQRFYCTEYPPCQLSFTRSEHLARHIRKHTGERPFQCHCSRRFSRLDNLRQHAQTVHVNEDIPGDSLAATGTRFQRQIRTDRVRPLSSRSRASTLGGSTGSFHRGHGRNLSASSIASTASSMSQQDDGRRRPPPLAIASDATTRARLPLDTYNSHLSSPGGHRHLQGAESPSGFSTPTSSTFSPGTGSPRFPSDLQSPVSGPQTLPWGGRTPVRRLSVPSSANTFLQSPPQPSAGFPPPFPSPLPSSATSNFSGMSSIFASPTSSIFSSDSRRESLTAEADWRRRTWHPGTYSHPVPRPATSGLSYYQSADAPEPSYSPNPAASQFTRLPGIESFDYAPPQPNVLRRREPSPMQLDGPHRPPVFHGPQNQAASGPDDRRNHSSWDMSLHKGLTMLEIAGSAPVKEPSRHHHSHSLGAMPSSLSNPLHAPHAPHPSYFNPATVSVTSQPNRAPQTDAGPANSEPPITPRKNKRHGWYNGPLPTTQMARPRPPMEGNKAGQRTSPEDSSSSEGVSTPSASSIVEYHPVIMPSSGFADPLPQGVPVEEPQKVFPTPGPVNGYHLNAADRVNPEGAAAHVLSGNYGPQPSSGGNDMRRLEALVAVATREDQATPSS